MCQGVTADGVGGPGGAGGALGLTQQLMQMFQQLSQGGGGGGAGALPPNAFPQGCVSYYTVTVTSTDPCAIYSPTPISDVFGGPSGISNSLLDALGGSDNTNTNTNTNVSTILNDVISGGTNTNTSGTGSSTQFSGTTTGGLSGEVKLGSSGATVIANLRDGISEVAGFFGGSTFGGGQSQSVASRICTSRPWSGGGLIARFVPDTFFDGLCSRAGYQVGALQQPQGQQGTVTTTNTNTGFTSQQPAQVIQVGTNIIPPEADVWAEPLSVRLGTRTFIFWNSRGVNSCKVMGPSFEQGTLSGGASTVPITGPSTFTIECVAPDGTKVTDSVTVNLAI